MFFTGFSAAYFAAEQAIPPPAKAGLGQAGFVTIVGCVSRQRHTGAKGGRQHLATFSLRMSPPLGGGSRGVIRESGEGYATIERMCPEEFFKILLKFR